jgi:hypothetical protein
VGGGVRKGLLELEERKKDGGFGPVACTGCGYRAICGYLGGLFVWWWYMVILNVVMYK